MRILAFLAFVGGDEVGIGCLGIEVIATSQIGTETSS